VFEKETADKRIYHTVQGKDKTHRGTYQLTIYSNKIDMQKTEQAFMPNFVHGMDATLVRLM